MNTDKQRYTEASIVQNQYKMDNAMPCNEIPTFAKAMQAYLKYYKKLSTEDIGRLLGVRDSPC